MIIDCHGHYTTYPPELDVFRQRQLAAGRALGEEPAITDAQIRATIEAAQLKRALDRGIDLTIFSPRAAGMAHHAGDASMSEEWARVCNDLIYRVCMMFPRHFAGVCQLPQSPGVAPENCIPELERCVNELGFVGCNLNPDPSGGHWSGPPLTDRWWYPLYEKMVELQVPAMVHVSQSCNRNFHTTGSHYLNGDTTAFMQFLLSDLFKDFPQLKFVIPHGGGAVPYHWGRFRGLAQALKRPPLPELLLGNVYFDTCVYHQPGVELLTRVIPVDNVLFASETYGAVEGIDPLTGHAFDDTRRYIEAIAELSEEDRRKIYEGNARKVYARLPARIDQAAGLSARP